MCVKSSRFITRRRWYLVSKHLGCDADVGWFLVVESEGNCLWERGPFPMFILSDPDGAVASINGGNYSHSY